MTMEQLHYGSDFIGWFLSEIHFRRCHRSCFAVTWAANCLDSFGLGAHRQMYYRYWDGSHWGRLAHGPSQRSRTKLAEISRAVLVQSWQYRLALFCARRGA